MKYWPEKGKSGFLVWRYLLKRNDDEAAPWTKDGKERIKKLGLTMQVMELVCSPSVFMNRTTCAHGKLLLFSFLKATKSC